jgi:CHAT domain-containing protein
MIYRQSYLTPLLSASLMHAFACLLALVLIPTAGRSQSALQAGSSITREIGPTESHSYEFTLQRGQLIDLTLSAQDLNLRMRIMAADGSTLAEVVHRRYGSLRWNFIAPEAGEYQLAVLSLEQSPPSFQYEVKVNRIKGATEQEKKAALIATDFYRAEVLRLKSENNDLTSALDGYHVAADAWQQQGLWAEAADAWQQMGEVYFGRGDYKEALRAFEKALELSQKTRDLFLTITQQVNIGYVHVYLGNLEKASALFDKCQEELGGLASAAASTRERLEAQLKNNYGEIEYGRGNLKASLGLFAQALADWKETGDRRGMALGHLNAGYSYLDSGSIKEASTEFDEALKLCRETADWRGEALTLTAQGNLYSLLGDNYAALTLHRQARDILRRIGDQQGEAVTSNGMGKVFEDLNLKQEAIDNYSLALRLNHSIGNRDFEAVSDYYLGRVWRDLGDLPRALEYYQNSLTLSRQGGKSRMAHLALMDVAAIYIKQQKIDAAWDIYQETLAFYKKIDDLRRMAFTHEGLGELLRLRGDSETAMEEYKLGLDLFQRIKDPQGQAQSHYWLARLSQGQGRFDDALAESQKSIDIVELQRARVVGQNWRSSYFASVRRYFEQYVDILMQMDRQRPNQGFAALALAASERARARSLVELLTETQSQIHRDVEPGLLLRERQLRQELSATANYQMKTLNSARRDTDGTEIELKIRTLNTEYDIVQAAIRAQSPAYGQLSQPSTSSLNQIQAELKQDKDTVLIEYMLGDDRSYVWFVTPDTLIAHELPGRQVLQDLATEVYQSLTARQQQPNEDPARYHDRFTSEEKRFCPSSTQLSRLLLGPFRSLLIKQRLLVVADGNLQYIPFDALPTPAENDVGNVCHLDAEPTDYVPVLMAHEVVHLPSFSSLATLRRLGPSLSRPAREVAVWADPVFEPDDPRIAEYLRKPLSAQRPEPKVMPATQSQAPGAPQLADSYVPPTRLLATVDEAHSVMRFAPAGISMLLTGFAANRESALSGDLQDYRILHFATHSMINSRYPSLSGLLLSTVDERGQAQNGLLQLHDIYGLRLNADLVVLSGCQTGLGEELSGEGLIGLTQGFLYAGSRSVVVSLWDVQDRTTASLMGDFYQAMLKDGYAPADALRRAKLRMYQQDSSRAPFYWSAFVIQGEYRSRPASWRQILQSRLLWSGLVLACIVTWLLFSSWWRLRTRQSST